MSYLVLARKWRPMTFEQVVDQKHVIVTIQNAIKSDRLANAYLFAGPRGVGKTTVARILAKAVNCMNGPTTTPCNECSSCKDITGGRSLDVLEIDGASNRGIDEVRNLRENIKYAPTQGKHKIYIIDEVHMLTDPAFNALLKTLEEPPQRVMFIFATTEPHKILATILSRCQRFDFKRITHTEIMDHLRNISREESIDIEEEALHLIARKADGSMRDGQSLLDQAVSFSGEKISVKELGQLLGVIDQEIFFRAADVLVNKDRKAGLLLIDEIFLNGFDLTEFLIGLNDHFRNMLLVKSMSSTELLEISEHYAEKYLSAAVNFNEQDLLRLIKIVSDTEYLLKRSSNQRFTLEVSLMKMINLLNTIKLDDIISEIGAIKEQFKGTVTQVLNEKREGDSSAEKKNDIPQPILKVEDKEEKKPEKSKVIILEEVQNLWPDIIDEVKKTKIALGSFLNEGLPSKIEENTVVLSFGSSNGFHIDNVMKNLQIIENVMNKFLHTTIKIKCIKDESMQVESKNSGQESDLVLDKLAMQVSQVKTILEVFDVELIR